jgi:hypothetical protein
MFARRRPLLRAAVVGGGAYMAGKSAAGRRADQEQLDADQDARISGLEQQQPPAAQQASPQIPPQASPQSSPMIDQLNQLATLHQQGVLSDDEFAAAKAKLFGT